MLRRFLVVLGVVSLLFSAGVAPATTYTLTDLGGAAGYNYTATAVNVVGGNTVVAGWAQNNSTYAVSAWYWTQGTGMVDLTSTLTAAFGSITQASATGVNSSGKIVGYYNTNYGFTYTVGGGVTSLLPPSGGGFTAVNGVNANGQVAGWYTAGIDPTSRAAICYTSGAAGTPIGVGYSARAINSNGWVAGANVNVIPNRPSIYNGSTWTDIALPSGYTRTAMALAINSNGDTVGSVGITSNTQTNPFYAPYGGAMVDLGNWSALPGYTTYLRGQAQGISDSGQVVGWYFAGSKSLATEYAFLGGTTAGSSAPLSNYVPAGLGNFARLSQALAIDSAGHIVGAGLYPAGDGHAFLLTPVPEPSTLVLAALGLMGLVAYAWRKRK